MFALSEQGEAAEIFRTGEDLEGPRLGLSGLEAEAGESERALDAVNGALGVAIVEEVEAASPDGFAARAVGDGDDVDEILIFRRGPGDVGSFLLVDVLRGAELDAGEGDGTFVEPVDVGEGRLAVAIPVEAGVDGHVGRMDRCGAAGADIKTEALGGAGAWVGEIDGEVDRVVALAGACVVDDEGFADDDAVGHGAGEDDFVGCARVHAGEAAEGGAGGFGEGADGEGLGDVEGDIGAILAEVAEENDFLEAAGVADEMEIGESGGDGVGFARDGGGGARGGDFGRGERSGCGGGGRRSGCGGRGGFCFLCDAARFGELLGGGRVIFDIGPLPEAEAGHAEKNDDPGFAVHQRRGSMRRV